MNFQSAKKSSSESIPSKALAAVAFQDHLLRDLSIGNLSSSLKETKFSVTDSLRLKEKQRKLALKKTKPTVDTGLRKKVPISNKSKSLSEESEHVLDPKPKPMSLAQKLGLVPHNKDQEKLLSETEWKNLKEMSIKRDDYKNPCVICKDNFRLEHQVLLSCSHFFHKACLQAFERFSGRKTCPMCRHESYQTRVVHDGTKYYKLQAATRIQALWRGYVVRKWYQKLRKTVPPKDKKLRRKFYEEKLSEITDRMVAMTSSDRIDRFLNDVNQSLAHSRSVFSHFEKSVLSNLTAEEWMQIEEKAVTREVTECPICLRSLELSEATITGDSESGLHEVEKKESCKESIALLSCTHVFHATCLNALETFSRDDYNFPNTFDPGILGDSEAIFAVRNNWNSFKCPVCRAVYLKRVISL